MDKNKTINEKVKELIKKQYRRSYAKNITNVRQRKQRNVEWNFCSEESGRGMEWRSFNVTGITTWENLSEMFEIAWKTLAWMSKETRGFYNK